MFNGYNLLKSWLNLMAEKLYYSEDAKAWQQK